jgi:hypothetical protein
MLRIWFLFLSLAGTEIGGAIRDPDTTYRQVDFSTQLNVRSGFTAARCRGIADISSKVRPLFQVKENGEWECTYLLEYPETGHSPSLFIQVRGVHPEQWSSFRLKLNFGSLLSRQVLGGRAAAIVYTLIGDQSPLRELDVTLALGREFDLSFSGITLRYKQEAFDASRYNLYGGNALEVAKPHQ